MALNRSPEFCLKLTYRNLLKADHVPGDTWGKPFLAPRAFLNKLGRGPLGDATYQISRLYGLWFQTTRFFHVFRYIGLCKTCDPWGGAIFGPKDII